MKKTLTPLLFVCGLTSSFAVLANTYQFPCPSPKQVMLSDNGSVAYSSPEYDSTAGLPPGWVGNNGYGVTAGWSGTTGSNKNQFSSVVNITFEGSQIIPFVTCLYGIKVVANPGYQPVLSVAMIPGGDISGYDIMYSKDHGYLGKEIIATDKNK